MPETPEKEAVQALIDRFDRIEKVDTTKEGKLAKVSLRGLPQIENASFRMTFDPATQRVVEVGGNKAAFWNDQWKMFTPLKELRVINLHHNFGTERENRATLYDASGGYGAGKPPALGIDSIARQPLRRRRFAGRR